MLIVICHSVSLLRTKSSHMKKHKNRVLLKRKVERRRKRNRKRRRTSLERTRERAKALVETHLHQSDKQGESG